MINNKHVTGNTEREDHLWRTDQTAPVKETSACSLSVTCSVSLLNFKNEKKFCNYYERLNKRPLYVFTVVEVMLVADIVAPV